MNDIIKLSNPPLVETAFCVEMKAGELTENRVRAIISKVAPDFTEYSPIIENNFTWNMNNPAVGPVAKQGWVGAHFKKNANLIITLRMAPHFKSVLFAYSMLAPYTEWDDFHAKSDVIFTGIQKDIQPEKILRIGVRSIDRIVLPSTVQDLRDYVRTLPLDATTEDDVPTPIKHFLYQDQYMFQQPDMMATVVRASQHGQDDRMQAIVLDTDVYFQPKESLTRDAFDAKMKIVRSIKDKLFFGTIGPKAKEMFV